MKDPLYVTRYVPYNVPGIHEIITEDTYSSEGREKNTEVSSISASPRIRNKMSRYSEIMINERKEEIINKMNDELYIIILKTQPENVEIFQFHPGLIFN